MKVYILLIFLCISGSLLAMMEKKRVHVPLKTEEELFRDCESFEDTLSRQIIESLERQYKKALELNQTVAYPYLVAEALGFDLFKQGWGELLDLENQKQRELSPKRLMELLTSFADWPLAEKNCISTNAWWTFLLQKELSQLMSQRQCHFQDSVERANGVIAYFIQEQLQAGARYQLKVRRFSNLTNANSLTSLRDYVLDNEYILNRMTVISTKDPEVNRPKATFLTKIQRATLSLYGK